MISKVHAKSHNKNSCGPQRETAPTPGDLTFKFKFSSSS